jgi:pimeloyl-ACP methyl ester carboxylesterase
VAYAPVNGLNLYYEVHGEGPPLLLLNGGGCAIEVPPLGLPAFAEHYRVIAMDPMGHGRTGDNLDREFHYHDLGEDAVGLLRHLEVDRAVLVGFSDGGNTALDIAIHHPDLVAKLVLTGANFNTSGTNAESLEWVLKTKPEDWPPFLRETHQQRSPDGPDGWARLLGRLYPMWRSEPDLSPEELGRIKAPTLIVVGDRDIVSAEHAVAMFRAIPGSNLCVVPGGEHGVMPLETVLGFLRGEEAA